MMRTDELAEELAEFWLSAMLRTHWHQRVQLLNAVHEQLRIDLETRAEYDALSPRFVAAVIERLGAPPVANPAQAQIYALSANEFHREAAGAWLPRGVAADARRTAGFVRENQRQFAREPVNTPTEIWVQGHAARCRLVDLSPRGARVVVPEPAPEPGTPVRLAVPETGILFATVVFRNSVGIGVRFANQLLAA